MIFSLGMVGSPLPIWLFKADFLAQIMEQGMPATIINGMEVAKTEMYHLAENVGSVFQNPKSQFFNIDSDSEITFGLENQC